MLEDETGVEPIVMKLMAGIILFAIGLGIGVTIYLRAGSSAERTLSFNVSVSPTSATVGGDGNTTANVIVQEIFGYNKQVTLTASYDLTYVENVIFSPQNGIPSFTSTVTIIAKGVTTPGTTITIYATGADGTKKAASFELTIQ